jgi:hypothetical protein
MSQCTLSICFVPFVFFVDQYNFIRPIDPMDQSFLRSIIRSIKPSLVMN